MNKPILVTLLENVEATAEAYERNDTEANLLAYQEAKREYLIVLGISEDDYDFLKNG
jgi:hypothetical protein